MPMKSNTSLTRQKKWSLISCVKATIWRVTFNEYSREFTTLKIVGIFITTKSKIEKVLRNP